MALKIPGLEGFLKKEPPLSPEQIDNFKVGGIVNYLGRYYKIVSITQPGSGKPISQSSRSFMLEQWGGKDRRPVSYQSLIEDNPAGSTPDPDEKQETSPKIDNEKTVPTKEAVEKRKKILTLLQDKKTRGIMAFCLGIGFENRDKVGEEDVYVFQNKFPSFYDLVKNSGVEKMLKSVTSDKEEMTGAKGEKKKQYEEALKYLCETIYGKNYEESFFQESVWTKPLSPEEAQAIKVLGLETKNVKFSDIKQAYRALVKKTHPDHNPQKDGSEFNQIQRALKTLEKRFEPLKFLY